MVFVPIVLAALWGAVAVDLVVESVRVDGTAVVAFGRVLAEPPVTETIVVLCVVSASAALALVIAVARLRGRRLERRMAGELDAGWAALAEREGADSARQELLTWRVTELQTMVDDLLAERPAPDGRRLIVVPDHSDVSSR